MPEIPLENMSIRQLCVADFYFWLVELFFFPFAIFEFITITVSGQRP